MYRLCRGCGLTSLAVWTGLMAASLPLVLSALFGEANLVTLILGHEKSNAIHRWVDWMTLERDGDTV